MGLSDLVPIGDFEGQEYHFLVYLIDNIHKHTIGKVRPDITFVLKVKISTALKRLNKRKVKNRYDKFHKSFYINAQKSFIKIAKKNRSKYFILDNSFDNPNIEKVIFDSVYKKIKKF